MLSCRGVHPPAADNVLQPVKGCYTLDNACGLMHYLTPPQRLAICPGMYRLYRYIRISPGYLGGLYGCHIPGLYRLYDQYNHYHVSACNPWTVTPVQDAPGLMPVLRRRADIVLYRFTFTLIIEYSVKSVIFVAGVIVIHEC